MIFYLSCITYHKRHHILLGDHHETKKLGVVLNTLHEGLRTGIRTVGYHQ
jgi:hypothetical protein